MAHWACNGQSKGPTHCWRYLGPIPFLPFSPSLNLWVCTFRMSEGVSQFPMKLGQGCTALKMKSKMSPSLSPGAVQLLIFETFLGCLVRCLSVAQRSPDLNPEWPENGYCPPAVLSQPEGYHFNMDNVYFVIESAFWKVCWLFYLLVLFEHFNHAFISSRSGILWCSLRAGIS